MYFACLHLQPIVLVPERKQIFEIEKIWKAQTLCCIISSYAATLIACVVLRSFQCDFDEHMRKSYCFKKQFHWCGESPVKERTTQWDRNDSSIMMNNFRLLCLGFELPIANQSFFGSPKESHYLCTLRRGSLRVEKAKAEFTNHDKRKLNH